MSKATTLAPMRGRAFLRPYNGGDVVQRVMILAVVEVGAGTFEEGEDYACDVDGQLMGDGGQAIFGHMGKVTEHVPRGADASRILTGHIAAVWRRDSD